MAFINAPGPALTYLPQTMKQEDFQVVFSNATAEDVDLAKKKFVRSRAKRADRTDGSVCDEEQLGLCRQQPGFKGSSILSTGIRSRSASAPWTVKPPSAK